jgi:hypothetical protein
MATPEINLPLRTRFGQAQVAMEKLTSLARQMNPETEKGDWGKWIYNPTAGIGTLYVPFGHDGVAAVELSCGGDDGNNAIAEASFTRAAAIWSATLTHKDVKKEYKFAAIALPSSLWYENRGKPVESMVRHFAFYQEAKPDQLILAQYGSNASGWKEYAFDEAQLVQFDPYRLPTILSYQDLYATITQQRDFDFFRLPLQFLKY